MCSRFVPTTLAFLLTLCPLFAADGHDHGTPAPAGGGPGGNNATLTEIQRENLGLQVVPLEERPISSSLVAYGQLELMPGRSSIVSSRVPARIIAMDIPPGGLVIQGQRILELESRQPGPPPPPFPVEAPMSGTVSQWLVRPGQQVEPADALMEIVNLDQLHGVANLFESDLATLSSRIAKEGPESVKAQLRPIGSNDAPIPIRFDYFGLQASPEAGRVPVRFIVDNPDGRLRPGMRVAFDIDLESDEAPVPAVPSEAIQGEFGDNFIWVQAWDNPGSFEKIPVVRGRSGGGWTEVRSDRLLPDDLVVTQGAFALQYVGPGSTSIPDTHHGHDHSHSHDHGEGEGGHGAEEGEAGHDHSHGSSPAPAANAKFATWLVWTLGGTCAGLVLLLILAVATRRRPTPPRAEPKPPAPTPPAGPGPASGHGSSSISSSSSSSKADHAS